jgi:hypothetical protein
MPGKIFPFEKFKTGAAAGVDKYNILSVIVFIFRRYYLSRTSMPGKVFPSRNSKQASPPVPINETSFP